MNIDTLRTPWVKPAYDAQSGCLRLAFTGDLRSTTAPNIYRDAFGILAHDCTLLIQVNVLELDITEACIVDSMGLNLVISVLKWAKQRNAPVRILIGIHGVYATMLALGLDRHAELINRQ